LEIPELVYPTIGISKSPEGVKDPVLIVTDEVQGIVAQETGENEHEASLGSCKHVNDTAWEVPPIKFRERVVAVELPEEMFEEIGERAM